MKKIICLILLCFGIFNIFPGDIDKNILEQAYFELSGIWGDDEVEDVLPLWVRSDFFSWGYVKDYNPEGGSIIDLGSSDKLIDLYKYSYIKKQGDIYKFTIPEEHGYLYILVREKGKISYKDKPDSVTGDYPLRRLSGPEREFVNQIGIMCKSSSLYVLPSQESNEMGTVESHQNVHVIQKTLKDELVSNFIPWVKIRVESGEEGWVLADDVGIEVDLK